MHVCPPILYKYRELNDFTKALLKNGELYFATTKELNDPFEKFFTFNSGTYHTLTAAEARALGHEPNARGTYKLTAIEYTQYMHNGMTRNERYGILSLCEVNNSLPMYSHYAAGFKGICIGFDWEAFDLYFAGSHPKVKNFPRKVIYQTDPPELDRQTQEEWIRVITTKSEDFVFEREWRMFYDKGVISSEDQPAIRRAIRQITFGHATTEEQRHEVMNLTQDLEDVVYSITKPIIGSYNLEVISLS